MRYMVMLLALFFFAWAVPAGQDAEAASWARAINIPGSDSAIFAVDQTPDGGFILAGAAVRSSVDAVCIKVNASGMIQWAKAFDGGKVDLASTVVHTSDGGYVFAGYTDSSGSGRYDAWVVKLDGNGNTIWQKTYGTSWIEQAERVIEGKDGSLFLIGNYQRYGTGGGWDGWCAKLTRTGNVVWWNTYKRKTDEILYDAAPTVDGGLLLAGQGETRSKGWLVRINAIGVPLWQRVYGIGDPNAYPSIEIAATAVTATVDGGAVVGGAYGSYVTGEYRGWVVKVDSSGTLLWQSGFQADDNVQVMALRQENDGHVLVVGTLGPINQSGSNVDAWSARLDAEGKMFWQNAFGRTTLADDMVSAIQGTSDDGTLLVGYRITETGWNSLVVRTSPDGNTCTKYRSTKKVSTFTLNTAAGSTRVNAVKSVVMTRTAKSAMTVLKAPTVNLCAAAVR